MRRSFKQAGAAWRGALLIAALTAGLLLAGCSGAHTRPMPPAEPGVRVAFPDYSILPPAGDGWRVAEHKGDSVVFGRLLSRTHSTVALSSEKTIDKDIESQAALLAFEKTEQAKSEWTHGARYQARQSEMKPDSRFGPYCVHYRLQSEDHGATNRGDAPFLLQRSQGLVCFQPKRPRHLVHVGYTERGLPTEMSVHFADNAERFLSGLRLADLP